MFGLKSISEGAVSGLMGSITNLVDVIFKSESERITKKTALARVMQQPDLLQAELNKIEAQSRSLLIAGWRPFLGWVLGCALAYNFLAVPILDGMGVGHFTYSVENQQATISLITALLGMSGLRTYEKMKGKTR